MSGIFHGLIARWIHKPTKGESEMMRQQELFEPVAESSIDPDEIKERAVAIALELEGVPVADAFRILALVMAMFTLGRKSTKSAKEAAVHWLDDIAEMAVEAIREQR